jgi:hypothetical protein
VAGLHPSSTWFRQSWRAKKQTGFGVSPPSALPKQHGFSQIFSPSTTRRGTSKYGWFLSAKGSA